MNLQIDVQKFFEFVKLKHARQTYGGEPYHQHCLNVANRVSKKLDAFSDDILSSSLRDNLYCLGLGHDLLEDCAKTDEAREELLREIMSFGFAPQFPSWLHGLSRLDFTLEYQQWIKKMAASEPFEVILVKLCDNEENSEPANIATLPEEKRSILRRYQRAHMVLKPAYDALVSDLVSRSPSP